MKFDKLVERCKVFSDDDIYVYIKFQGDWKYIPLSHFSGETVTSKLNSISIFGEPDYILFTDDNVRVYMKDIERD
ncbi:gp413 [Bacillus phage G]|uniref:Gp413 n=1 Tax=Bacillus phage G TaxID=2884420 RepID=G3MAF4_9CAUD|nr:gp413 [Bacillus phage G]AEO93671.1 gp413 [Bacillus phage G]